jgi:hypothetical protein
MWRADEISGSLNYEIFVKSMVRVPINVESGRQKFQMPMTEHSSERNLFAESKLVVLDAEFANLQKAYSGLLWCVVLGKETQS